MAFMIFCLDKPNHVDTRLANRPAHVEHLTNHESHLISAGPLLTDDGETMIGSLLAIDFDSREAAQAWLAGEPFYRAGLYASATIHAFVNLWPQKAGFAPAT